MKIIFLDIDGVLNHQLFFEEKKRSNIILGTSEIEDWFDQRSVSLLKEIVDTTGAKIVVSSSWRKNRSLDQLKEIFHELGFKKDTVIDKTPVLYFSSNEKYNYSVPRGCEIKAWMEMNKGIIGEKMSKVSYVILDDDSDMLYWQRNNFIHVDSYCGITFNTVFKAIQILNKN